MRSSVRRLVAGFVLPTTMLVTTLLTVMLTAAFIMVSAEFRTTDNSMAGAHALALAQAGLQTYFASNRTIGAATTYDSVRSNLTYGYVDIVARRLRPASGGGPSLWIVRATGVSTEGRLGGQTQGKRVVAQFAQLYPGTFPARAALVSPNGTQIIGASGDNPLSGDDLGTPLAPCVSPGGSAADTFAISTSSYSQSPTSSGTLNPEGEGAWGSITGVNMLASAQAVLDSTHIDWASILAGNYAPDYNVATSGWPTPNNANFQVGFMNGDATIPASPYPFTGNPRRGILIVTGNLLVSDGAHFDGLILVGGKLDYASGNTATNFYLHGMVVTGLNMLVGGTVGPNIIQRGGVRSIGWTYCYARNAVASLSAMVPIANAWVDTWTTY